MLRIGWATNQFTLDYIRDSSIIKNVREVPILKEFLKDGDVYWLGGSSKQFQVSHPHAHDCSAILSQLPKYDAEKFGSTKKYVRHVIDNYQKIALPKLDFLFLNAFPSFLHRNLRTYFLWYYYASRGTRVFIYDVEMRLTLYSMVNGKPPDDRLWQISGADTIFTDEEYDMMATKAVFLYPIGKKGIAYMEKCNPKLRFETFYFAFDPEVTPIMEMKEDISTLKRDLIYIGNDTGRRKGFMKYFKALPEGSLTVYGGKSRGEEEGFEESFKERLPNVCFAGKIPHTKVNVKYRNSLACLSIGKPRFDLVTFQSARWMEAVFSGCVCLLPKDMPEAGFYVGENNVIKSSGHLARRIEKLKANPELRYQILKFQRKKFKELFSIEEQIKRIYRWL